MQRDITVTISVTAIAPAEVRWDEGHLLVRGAEEARESALEVLVSLGRDAVEMGPTMLQVDLAEMEKRVVRAVKKVGTLAPPGFPLVEPIPSVKVGEVSHAGIRVLGGWTPGEEWVDTGETLSHWLEASVTVLAWAEVKRNLGELMEDTPHAVIWLLQEFLGLKEEDMEAVLQPPVTKPALKGADKLFVPFPGPYATLAREAHRISGVIAGQSHPRVALDGYLSAWGLKGVHLTPAPGLGWTGKARGVVGAFHMALLELAHGEVRFCQNCGRILHGRVDKRFCSDSCRVVWNRKRKRGKGN